MKLCFRVVALEGLRRQPWRLSAATRGWASVRTVQLTKACPDWRDEACRVRAVLRGVWRASSLVECVNSVARMQQARHRKMTQGLEAIRKASTALEFLEYPEFTPRRTSL